MSPFDLVVSQPQRLVALALVPLTWLALYTLDRRRARRRRGVLGERAARIAPAPKGIGAQRVLVTLAVALAVVALAEPRGRLARSSQQRGALDVVVCLDLSRSMLARDIAPTRLERACLEIERFVEESVGERFGLVVFAGEGRVAAPLSSDGAALLELLDASLASNALRGGTDLGRALVMAGEVLARGNRPGSDPRGRAVVLFTDGEDHAGGGLEAAGQLAALGVPLLVIGLGSTRGSKIVVEEDGRSAFLKDASGRDVVSTLDEAGLAAIAESGGGAFQRIDGAGEVGVALSVFEEQLMPHLARAQAARGRDERPHRHVWFEGAALVCLLSAACVGGGLRS